MPDRSRLRPTWDWEDPVIRTYPRLRLKLALGFVLGGVAVGVVSYFIGEQESTSAAYRVVPVVGAWCVMFPFLIAGILGNIKRLAPPHEGETTTGAKPG